MATENPPAPVQTFHIDASTYLLGRMQPPAVFFPGTLQSNSAILLASEMGHPWPFEDNMNISAAGLALVKRSEGFRSHVYLDVNGFPTIGYGHRLQHAEAFPDGIGEAAASELLMADLHQAEEAVARLVHVPLTQGQFDALVDFCFNLGQGRLAGSTLLADLNAGRSEAAAMQLLLWDHAGGRECTALRARRQAEFLLWRGSEPGRQSAA